jgi:signal transduction histidine kinase
MILSVLRNLLSNALKFTPSGGNITLTAERKDKYVHVSVIDTGIGIDPKNVQKLFRIDENYTRKGTNKEPGSGLGLILCKEFVEKNNGIITVESQEFKGSVFRFTVPVAE